MPTRRNTDLAKQLWAVGDPVRLRILSLLPPAADCEHGNNVSTLARRLGSSQPTVSHHLRGVMLWEVAMDDASHSLLDALSGPVLASR